MIRKATIRIESAIADSIMANMGNLTAGATYMVEAYYYVREQGLREIRAMFTLPELKLMLDAENGVAFSSSLITGFPGHIYDAMSLDRLDRKWGVDRDALMKKLNDLPLSTMIVLEEWLNYYWYGRLGERPPIEKYLTGE